MTSAHPLQNHETTGHPRHVRDELGEVDSGAFPLSSQVGGHAGVLSSEDGSLIIKPCLKNELEFYSSIAVSQAAISAGIESDSEDIAIGDSSGTASSSPFAGLAPWVPKFYGTLKLEGRIENHETATAIKPVPEASEKDKYTP